MLKKNLGFALFEVMIATIILCGLIYMFIAFSHTQQKQINSQNVGKHLSIAVNQLLTSVAQTNHCPNGNSAQTQNFAQCVNMSEEFKTTLRNDGIDIDNSTVTISKA